MIMHRRYLFAAMVVTTLSLFTGASLLGCGGGGGDDEDGEEGATMKPGEACLSCHSPGSEEGFTAAGTVYTDASGGAPLAGATISIIDDAGRQVTLTSNSAGNFFTSKTLTLPLSITVSDGANEATMLTGAPSGDCNDCHSAEGAAGFRIFVP